MITINLSEKDAEALKNGCNYLRLIKAFNDNEVNKNVIQQINNQQFDVSDFESSRQYEAMSVQSAGFIPKTELTKGKGWRISKLPREYSHLTNWDKATKK